MPAKRSALEGLDNIGADLTLAMIDAMKEEGPPEIARYIRMAIFNLTLAKLWHTCPDAMAQAESLGAKPMEPPFVKRVVPPLNHNASLPSKDRIA